MKKIISCILALVFVLSLFSGCGKEKITSALYNPDVKVGDTGGLSLPLSDGSEEIHWSVTSNTTGLNDSYVVKKLREITGANVQLDVFASGTADQKLKVLAASKDLPDIIGQGLDVDFAEELCLQGAFAAVQDYLDVTPNFKRIFVDDKEKEWLFKSYTSADGKLYGFYGWDWNRDINHGMLYRKDIFDKHGIELWNSPETFYQALKKLKEIYPDSYPFVSKNGTGIFEKLGTSWGLDCQDPYYDEKTKTWKFSETDPKYKDMLDFIKKLYNEGLFDPEFITATQAAWTQKMTMPDKAFVTFDWIDRMNLFKEQTAETVPEYDLRFAPPIGPEQTYPGVSQLYWAYYVSNNSKAETGFKLLDFALSPAGRELFNLGIEGETFEIGEDGKAIYLEFKDKDPTTTELEEKYGMFITGMGRGIDRRSIYFKFSEATQEAQDYAAVEGHMAPLDPILTFTEQEKERNSEVLTPLRKDALEFSVQYILNNGGDKEWNEWLKKAEKHGYKELEKIYNDAQKRYDAK